MPGPGKSVNGITLVKTTRSLPSPQDKVARRTVAGVGCKACHGPFAEGKVGPTNRGVNEATIREALAKVGPMQFLREQLADEDIRRVADAGFGRFMTPEQKKGQSIIALPSCA